MRHNCCAIFGLIMIITLMAPSTSQVSGAILSHPKTLYDYHVRVTLIAETARQVVVESFRADNSTEDYIWRDIVFLCEFRNVTVWDGLGNVLDHRMVQPEDFTKWTYTYNFGRPSSPLSPSYSRIVWPKVATTSSYKIEYTLMHAVFKLRDHQSLSVFGIAPCAYNGCPLLEELEIEFEVPCACPDHHRAFFHHDINKVSHAVGLEQPSPLIDARYAMNEEKTVAIIKFDRSVLEDTKWKMGEDSAFCFVFNCSKPTIIAPHHSFCYNAVLLPKEFKKEGEEASEWVTEFAWKISIVFAALITFGLGMVALFIGPSKNVIRRNYSAI